MVFINHSDVLDGRVTIVDIEGALDSKTSPDFENYISQLLSKGKFFILLNSAKLSYVSSEGIGLILLIQKKIAENNGSFIIFNLPEEIRSLYALLGFDKVFRIANSRIEAMQIMDKNLELRERHGDIHHVPETKPEEQDYHSKPDAFEQDITLDISEQKGPQLEISERPRQTVTEFAPFIVECPQCSTMIRVKQRGDFLCPQCNIEFTVHNDKTVSF